MAVHLRGHGSREGDSSCSSADFKEDLRAVCVYFLAESAGSGVKFEHIGEGRICAQALFNSRIRHKSAGVDQADAALRAGNIVVDNGLVEIAVRIHSAAEMHG